jgi:hypothetical protein
MATRKLDRRFNIRPAATMSVARRRVVLLSAVVALIPIVMLANLLRPRGLWSVDPTISIERTQLDESASVHSAPSPPSLPDDGEVYRTADRLREASAVAVAAALYAANEQASRRPVRSVNSIVAGIRSAGLLPPGVSAEPPAMLLLSQLASLQLRYRPDPLGVEVLSLPRSRKDGPALMVRIPGVEPDGDRGSVFIADRLGDIALPAAFASIADCVRAGWVDQSFDQTDTTQEQQQLRAWLSSRRPR